MALDALRERIANPRPGLELVGRYLVGEFQSTFRLQGRGGVAWGGRSVPNRLGILADLAAGRVPPERRWDERPAGVDTNRLASSQAYEVVGDRLRVGSELPYASDVQLGGPRSVAITGSLRTALAAWLRKLSGKAKRARRENYPAHEARYQAARAAFGPLFRTGVLSVDVPPRPFAFMTEENRRRAGELYTSYLLGRPT